MLCTICYRILKMKCKVSLLQKKKKKQIYFEVSCEGFYPGPEEAHILSGLLKSTFSEWFAHYASQTRYGCVRKTLLTSPLWGDVENVIGAFPRLLTRAHTPSLQIQPSIFLFKKDGVILETYSCATCFLKNILHGHSCTSTYTGVPFQVFGLLRVK